MNDHNPIEGAVLQRKISNAIHLVPTRFKSLLAYLLTHSFQELQI